MRPRIARMLVSSLLAAGCDSEAPAPRAAPEEPAHVSPSPPAEPAEDIPPAPAPDEAAALVRTMEALAEVHRVHVKDCAALARELRAFRAQHPELAAASKSAYQKLDADDALRERMRAAMTDIMSAGMACKEAPEFRALRAALSGAPP